MQLFEIYFCMDCTAKSHVHLVMVIKGVILCLIPCDYINKHALSRLDTVIKFVLTRGRSLSLNAIHFPDILYCTTNIRSIYIINTKVNDDCDSNTVSAVLLLHSTSKAKQGKIIKIQAQIYLGK